MEHKQPHPRKERPKASSGYNNSRAARRYRAGVERKVEAGEVKPAARRARDSIESPEGEELERAARQARKGPASVREPVERAVERAENEGMTTRSDSDRSEDVEDVERDMKRSP